GGWGGARYFAWNGAQDYVYAVEGRAADPRAEPRGRIHSDMEGGMNKAELADALAERTGIQRKDSRAAVGALCGPGSGLVARALPRGEQVSRTGFGPFEVRERRAGTARNPRAGEMIEVPATRAAAFRAGKGLKDGIPGR